jgi:hypothetical protein
MMVIAPFMPLTGAHTLTLDVATAVAVASATVVSFLKDFGRMAVRVAARDLGGQMLAWTSRRFLAVLVAVGLSTLFASARFGNSTPSPTTIAGAGVIGAAIALLGEPAVTAVRDRAAAAFGVTAIKTVGPTLKDIEGLDEETIDRLAEERIDSVHRLAFFVTPRLYFLTRFSLRQICDWQDQAILFVRLGELRAKTFKDQYGIRGITQATAFARRLLEKYKATLECEEMQLGQQSPPPKEKDPAKTPSPAPGAPGNHAPGPGEPKDLASTAPKDTCLDDVRKMLGLSTTEQARNVLEQLRGDPLAVGIEWFLQGFPDPHDHQVTG